MRVRVKICGVRDLRAVDSACAAGAGYLGFNFFPKSPRFLGWDAARDLMIATTPGVMKVGLVVNPDAETLRCLEQLPLDMIQLHGGETPERVAEVRAMLGLPVMKALGIGAPEDVARIAAFEAVADQILVDARPAPQAALPGGSGLCFDWRLIAGRRWTKPWMLAGGLNPGNVAEAIGATGARQVDVASGVESAPGVQDREKVAAFIREAQK